MNIDCSGVFGILTVYNQAVQSVLIMERFFVLLPNMIKCSISCDNIDRFFMGEYLLNTTSLLLCLFNQKKITNKSLASISILIHGPLVTNIKWFFTVCLKLPHNLCYCINKSSFAYLCKFFSLSKKFLYANIY